MLAWTLDSDVSVLQDPAKLSCKIKGGGDKKETDVDEEVATLTSSTPSTIRYS